MSERFGPTKESLKESFFTILGIFGIFIIAGTVLAVMAFLWMLGIALYCVLSLVRWFKSIF